jgi:sugar/nucleoside kinase (ribokinase family)
VGKGLNVAIDAIDSTGAGDAGDAFAGAWVASRAGVLNALPTIEDLRAFIRSRG